jgi:predicted phosphodiesterase
MKLTILIIMIGFIISACNQKVVIKEIENEPDDKAVIESLVEKETFIITAPIEEIQTEAPYSFEDLLVGSLVPSRLILSPGENPTEEVNITFALDQVRNDVEILVLDSEGYLVNTYSTSDTKNELASLPKSLTIYKSSLNDLKPNSSYDYYVQSGDLISKKHQFDTLGLEDVTLAFFGDLQGVTRSQYEEFRANYQQLLSTGDRPDLHLLAGDLVDDGESFEQWNFLDTTMADYFSKGLWMSAIGNHDASPSDEIFTHTFNFANNGIQSLQGRNYFVDLVDVRIAVLDTESPSLFMEQGAWLKNIMKDRDDVFKIVLMHRSAYPLLYNESYIRSLSTLFDETGIDLVLSGHDHIYSRTTMNEQRKVDVDRGVTYLVGGSGSGSKYYEEDTSINRYWKTTYYDKNNPVYTLINVKHNQMTINVYAIENKKSVIIDELQLNK